MDISAPADLNISLPSCLSLIHIFRKEKESEIYYSDLLLLTSKLDSLINQHGDSLEMAAFLWNDGDLPLVKMCIRDRDMKRRWRFT